MLESRREYNLKSIVSSVEYGEILDFCYESPDSITQYVTNACYPFFCGGDIQEAFGWFYLCFLQSHDWNREQKAYLLHTITLGYCLAGNIKNSLKFQELACKTKPSFSRYVLLARLYFGYGQLEKTIVTCQKALLLQEAPYVYYLQASAFSKLGKKGMAQSCVEKALSFNSKMHDEFTDAVEQVANTPKIIRDFSFCAYCQKTRLTLHICVACRTAAYCDRNCQKADWKGNHKQACVYMGMLTKHINKC